MNEASFAIERQCPQCGAPVSLEETDRIFMCPYCRVRHFIYSRDYFRYYLPPLSTAGAEILYAPYWRFKGMKLIICGNMTKHDIVDRSFCSIPEAGLPQSLGFLTQTLKMKFVEPETAGRFLAPTTPITNFLKILEMNTETWAYKSITQSSNLSINMWYAWGNSYIPILKGIIEIIRSLFIGEVVSLIYAPFFIRDGTLCNGITGEAVSSKGGAPAVSLSSAGNDEVPSRGGGGGREPTGKTVFVPALCPECGWDLQGEKDSHMMECGQCRRFWMPSERGLAAVEFSVPFSMEKADLWVPFWRMEAGCSNVPIRTIAEFCRLAIIPRTIMPADENEPFFLWTPAFKSYPDLFLRLGKIFTMRHETVEKPSSAPSPLHSVTLSASDAFQRFPALLAELTSDRKKITHVIKSYTFCMKSASLVFVPFIDKGTEFIHPHYDTVIFKSALSAGRSM